MLEMRAWSRTAPTQRVHGRVRISVRRRAAPALWDQRTPEKRAVGFPYGARAGTIGTSGHDWGRVQDRPIAGSRWRGAGAGRPRGRPRTVAGPFRQQHDRSASAAIQGLGHKPFDTAFAQGRAMTIDEIAAFAVGEEQRPKPALAAKTEPPAVLTAGNWKSRGSSRTPHRPADRGQGVPVRAHRRSPCRQPGPGLQGPAQPLGGRRDRARIDQNKTLHSRRNQPFSACGLRACRAQNSPIGLSTVGRARDSADDHNDSRATVVTSDCHQT